MLRLYLHLQHVFLRESSTRARSNRAAHITLALGYFIDQELPWHFVPGPCLSSEVPGRKQHRL